MSRLVIIAGLSSLLAGCAIFPPSHQGGISATVTPEEIVEWSKERIAAYKYPRRVWIVNELPKGPTGKILRREVHAPSH